MKLLRSLLDAQAKLYAPGGRLARLYPLYEAIDTFLYTSGTTTKSAPHARDAADLKRVMMTVVVALLPCVYMALYTPGLQANLAIARGGMPPHGWRGAVQTALGVGYDPASWLSCFVHGAIYYVPILFVTFVVGGLWEVLFACVRRHEINEGFLVTGTLFSLILPTTIPLWQVALGISFGVVIGKEVFGGVGYNIFNPALTGRAFLFFAYPAEITGDHVWVAADAVTKATPLAMSAQGGVGNVLQEATWLDSFLGFIPGSMGETSTLAILIGAAILIVTGVGSWRIMLSVAVGSALTATLLNVVGSATNPQFAMPFWWHFVVGGMAFATVFMATDPVTAPYTHRGQWIYGFLIGVLIIVVRVLNPAYPDGLLVAILLMNVFSPLIDHYVVRAHVQRRKARYGV
jgi:Na+-transporting NADH:ubiquinone oxidoreductase subunit B